MGWLSGYRKRIVGQLRDTTGGTMQGSVALPKYIDDFWNTIDASGYGVRVTLSDGVTEVTYDLASFDTATRAGALTFGDLAVKPNNRVTTFFLYYDPESSASDGTGTVSVTSAATTEFEQLRPASAPFRIARPELGQTIPVNNTTKTTTEAAWLWFDVTDVLDKPLTNTLYGHPRYEEIRYFRWTVETGGSDAAALYDSTLSTMIETLDGRTLIGALVQAGASGTDYTGILEFAMCTPGAATSERRIFEIRVLISVYDVSEA